jgi:hypothetical protein
VLGCCCVHELQQYMQLRDAGTLSEADFYSRYLYKVRLLLLLLLLLNLSAQLAFTWQLMFTMVFSAAAIIQRWEC